MGIPPYAICKIFIVRKGVPDPHPRAKFHCCGFKSVGLQPPNREKCNFWYILAPSGKF